MLNNQRIQGLNINRLNYPTLVRVRQNSSSSMLLKYYIFWEPSCLLHCWNVEKEQAQTQKVNVAKQLK